MAEVRNAYVKARTSAFLPHGQVHTIGTERPAGGPTRARAPGTTRGPSPGHPRGRRALTGVTVSTSVHHRTHHMKEQCHGQSGTRAIRGLLRRHDPPVRV